MVHIWAEIVLHVVLPCEVSCTLCTTAKRQVVNHLITTVYLDSTRTCRTTSPCMDPPRILLSDWRVKIAGTVSGEPKSTVISGKLASSVERAKGMGEPCTPRLSVNPASPSAHDAIVSLPEALRFFDTGLDLKLSEGSQHSYLTKNI